MLMRIAGVRVLLNVFIMDTTVTTAPTALLNMNFIYDGKEAISMFFRNKFLFCQYSISSPIVLNSSQAEFIASYSGFHVMAIASLQQLTADGHIRRLTVQPK